MPKLEAFFHYRNVDVSTLKELAKRWKPEAYSSFKKAQRTRRWPMCMSPLTSWNTTAKHFLKLGA
jgi:oligoribonuclease (3'-5' exoribonuclease)